MLERYPARSSRMGLLPLAILLGLATTGCGGTNTYPVEGKVLWPDDREARELAGGLVTFDCVEAKVGAQGPIQPDGSFRMGTFKPGDGAVVGIHKVAISFPLDGPGDPRPPKIHPNFFDPEKSGLVVTVEPKTNRVTLKVEPFKKRTP